MLSQCGGKMVMMTMISTSQANQRTPFFQLSYPRLRPPSSSSFISPSCLSPGFDQLPEIAHNKVLIAAGVSAAIGQLSKPFTSSLLYGRKLDFCSAIQPGGFPSTHSSAVVATATALALERGFADSIFGMAVVYASLVMYDAQGVRREVGNHAKTINRALSKSQVKSNDADQVVDSPTGISSSRNATLLVRSSNRVRQTSPMLISSGIDTDAEEGSNKVIINPLKESVGHTEVEVLADATVIIGCCQVIYLHESHLATGDFAWLPRARLRRNRLSRPAIIRESGKQIEGKARKMSGAQGAQPKESYTATTYESVEGGENKTKFDPRSREDEGGIEIDKLQEKVEDAAGKGGPVFGAAGQQQQHKMGGDKPDLGVTGTAEEG